LRLANSFSRPFQVQVPTRAKAQISTGATGGLNAASMPCDPGNLPEGPELLQPSSPSLFFLPRLRQTFTSFLTGNERVWMNQLRLGLEQIGERAHRWDHFIPDHQLWKWLLLGLRLGLPASSPHPVPCRAVPRAAAVPSRPEMWFGNSRYRPVTRTCPR